jgi:hypothetical protein
MAMKGIVHFINRQSGMVAIATDGHGYTIIELLSDDEIDKGDQMWWANDTGLGREDYKNLTKNKMMHVYVQNHWVGTDGLRAQLLVD